MAAHQLHAQRLAGVNHLAEDLLGLPFGCPVGQDHGGEEPGRARSHAGDVVRVDVDRVPADVVAGEGDGVRLGHQQPLAAGANDGRAAPARGAPPPGGPTTPRGSRGRRRARSRASSSLGSLPTSTLPASLAAAAPLSTVAGPPCPWARGPTHRPTCWEHHTTGPLLRRGLYWWSQACAPAGRVGRSG